MLHSRQSIALTGLAAAGLTAVALALANFVSSEPGENGGAPEYAITLGVSLLVTLVLFGFVIPRSERPARTGLIAGLLAILSVAVFWSGLPFVVGPAAILLGLMGRARPGATTQGNIAVAMGTLATAGAIVAVIVDQTM